MGKVEIKIRKKILTPDNLQQYRNYPALLKKYERNKRFKRALRIFIYSIALTVFVLGLVFISLWKIMLDRTQTTTAPLGIHAFLKDYQNKKDTVKLELLSNVSTDSLYIATYKGFNNKPDDIYKFPKTFYSNGTTTYRLMEEKKVTVSGREYIIKKYKYDVNHPSNLVYYFYCSDFGILIFASSWHENFYLNSTGDAQRDEVIAALIQAVREDKNFDYW